MKADARQAEALPFDARPTLLVAQLLRWVQVLCFAATCLIHTSDVLAGGWLPYRFAPMFYNVFWTSLAFWDLILVVFLLRFPRAGVVLGLVLMVADVAINTVYMDRYLLGHWHRNIFLQTLFLGFVLAAAPVLWLAGPHLHKSRR